MAGQEQRAARAGCRVSWPGAVHAKIPVTTYAVHVGQPHVAAAKAVREPLVVHAQEMKHGGVQVVNLDLVLDGMVAVVVGGAVDGASLDPAARQPDREAVGVVIAAVAALGHGRPAELAAPDDQRRLE